MQPCSIDKEDCRSESAERRHWEKEGASDNSLWGAGWKETPLPTPTQKAFHSIPQAFSLVLANLHSFFPILCVITVAANKFLYITYRKFPLCRIKAERAKWNKASLTFLSCAWFEPIASWPLQKRLQTEHLHSVNVWLSVFYRTIIHKMINI